MRDPARIQRILTKLATKWEVAPDLRLGQLLTNILANETKTTDLFNLEDDKAEAAIDRWSTAGYIHPKNHKPNPSIAD